MRLSLLRTNAEQKRSHPATLETTSWKTTCVPSARSTVNHKGSAHAYYESLRFSLAKCNPNPHSNDHQNQSRYNLKRELPIARRDGQNSLCYCVGGYGKQNRQHCLTRTDFAGSGHRRNCNGGGVCIGEAGRSSGKEQSS